MHAACPTRTTRRASNTGPALVAGLWKRGCALLEPRARCPTCQVFLRRLATTSLQAPTAGHWMHVTLGTGVRWACTTPVRCCAQRRTTALHQPCWYVCALCTIHRRLPLTKYLRMLCVCTWLCGCVWLQEPTQCPFNATYASYCPAGSSTATPCPAGSFCGSPVTVHACDQHYYCPAGSVVEKTCPAGSYCPTPATEQECPRGYYCHAGSLEPEECNIFTSCPAGTASETKSALGAIVVGLVALATFVAWRVYVWRRERKRALLSETQKQMHEKRLQVVQAALGGRDGAAPSGPVSADAVACTPASPTVRAGTQRRRTSRCGSRGDSSERRPSQRAVSSDSMPQSAQHMLRRSTQRGSGGGAAAGAGDMEMDELGDDGSTALISFGGLGRKVRLVHWLWRCVLGGGA